MRATIALLSLVLTLLSASAQGRAPICVLDGLRMRPILTNIDVAMPALGGYQRTNSIVYRCPDCQLVVTNNATTWVPEETATNLIHYRTLRLPVPEWPPYPVWPGEQTNAPIVLIASPSMVAVCSTVTNISPTDVAFDITRCLAGIRFQWQSETGKVYTVECSTNFSAWLPVTTVIGRGGLAEWYDAGPGPKWFRVSTPR